MKVRPGKADMMEAGWRVSIHAPVKVRRAVGDVIEHALCFNSRTCEGATRLPGLVIPIAGVSIHAPVKVRR